MLGTANGATGCATCAGVLAQALTITTEQTATHRSAIRPPMAAELDHRIRTPATLSSVLPAPLRQHRRRVLKARVAHASLSKHSRRGASVGATENSRQSAQDRAQTKRPGRNERWSCAK